MKYIVTVKTFITGRGWVDQPKAYRWFDEEDKDNALAYQRAMTVKEPSLWKTADIVECPRG